MGILGGKEQAHEKYTVGMLLEEIESLKTEIQNQAMVTSGLFKDLRIETEHIDKRIQCIKVSLKEMCWAITELNHKLKSMVDGALDKGDCAAYISIGDLNRCIEVSHCIMNHLHNINEI